MLTYLYVGYQQICTYTSLSRCKGLTRLNLVGNVLICVLVGSLWSKSLGVRQTVMQGLY